ncbi:MAG: ADP-ribosylglycohydrolase family protein [Candidatus Eisenbacteria bacterium]|uniref:ADP-ribosylglycohydrolase family protein n=1 Tax=Eiseniibacteriota bacterium TaxID=2212470 RepID=A0A956NAF8_UNCEI|nr:ADP-ribosylglycohydrolase family protein [Candidatus Eisenbacteria bacterium]
MTNTDLDILRDRVRGILLGLAAGDRIGGPIRMALFVAESLHERQGFERADLEARYLEWWRDGAFDTGPTVAEVLSQVERGISFDAAVANADKELRGLTAGCNPAHRAAPIAMSAPIADADIESVAIREAGTTHAHPLAGQTSAAVARLCRLLVRGTPWTTALQRVAESSDERVRRALEVQDESDINAGGFAPDTLAAAIYHLGRADSFAEAIDRSMAFAGFANYCPVLVGSIGGARWGRSQIEASQLEHHGSLVEKLDSLAKSMAADW